MFLTTSPFGALLAILRKLWNAPEWRFTTTTRRSALIFRKIPAGGRLGGNFSGGFFRYNFQWRGKNTRRENPRRLRKRESKSRLRRLARKANGCCPPWARWRWFSPGLRMLGGIADGALDFRLIFDIDTLRPRVFFRELFEEGRSVDGLRQSRAPYFFPDYAFQWVMFALGANLTVALYLFSLAQVALTAGWLDFGLRLSCSEKSPFRRAAVLLLHALAFLVLARGNADALYTHMTGHFHYGAWSALPWLLWLSFRVLCSDARRRGKSGRFIPSGPAAALVAFLSVSVASDLLIVPWFAAPAAFSAAALVFIGAMERRKFVRFCRPLGGGMRQRQGAFRPFRGGGLYHIGRRLLGSEY